jgi:phospholipid/cholesterol/gamma-HCH transport system substrate-binding protein
MQLQRSEFLTGALVLITVAVLTAILILLGAPGLFRPLVTYKIYFDNAAGIKLGAPVLLAGRKIGQVDKLYSPVSKQESKRVQEAVHSVDRSEAASSPSPSPSAPRYEVRIDVKVDKSALVYKDAKARLMSLGLLGDTAIDITQGNESSGRASDGELFVGDRVPDFGEAIAKLLDIVKPVALEATNTMKELQSTAQNLNHITDDNSQLNLALVQFRTFGEHLNEITAPEGSLSKSLKHIEEISRELTANDNIKVTLQNFRTSSEKLKSMMNELAPDLKASGDNIKDLTETVRTQPWRLIWPSTKKYPQDEQTQGNTITVRKTTKARPSPMPRTRR